MGKRVPANDYRGKGWRIKGIDAKGIDFSRL